MRTNNNYQDKKKKNFSEYGTKENKYEKNFSKNSTLFLVYFSLHFKSKTRRKSQRLGEKNEYL